MGRLRVRRRRDRGEAGALGAQLRRHESQAGEGRQLGGLGSRRLHREVVDLAATHVDFDGERFGVDQPEVRNTVTRVELALRLSIDGTGRSREDLDCERGRALDPTLDEYRTP